MASSPHGLEGPRLTIEIELSGLFPLSADGEQPAQTTERRGVIEALFPDAASRRGATDARSFACAFRTTADPPLSRDRCRCCCYCRSRGHVPVVPIVV